MDEQKLDAVFEDYLRHYETAWRAYDDVLPCLTALNGIRVAVLSNGDQAQQEDKLRRTGLARLFEVVLTSSSLGAAKPYPEAYRLACQRLGVEPEVVAYVGDRLDVDAEAAAAAGLHGVWLNRVPSRHTTFAPTINSLRDLPVLIAQFRRPGTSNGPEPAVGVRSAIDLAPFAAGERQDVGRPLRNASLRRSSS